MCCNEFSVKQMNLRGQDKLHPIILYLNADYRHVNSWSLKNYILEATSSNPLARPVWPGVSQPCSTTDCNPLCHWLVLLPFAVIRPTYWDSTLTMCAWLRQVYSIPDGGGVGSYFCLFSPSVSLETPVNTPPSSQTLPSTGDSWRPPSLAVAAGKPKQPKETALNWWESHVLNMWLLV